MTHIRIPGFSKFYKANFKQITEYFILISVPFLNKQINDHGFDLNMYLDSLENKDAHKNYNCQLQAHNL